MKTKPVKEDKDVMLVHRLKIQTKKAQKDIRAQKRKVVALANQLSSSQAAAKKSKDVAKKQKMRADRHMREKMAANRELKRHATDLQAALKKLARVEKKTSLWTRL